MTYSCNECNFIFDDSEGQEYDECPNCGSEDFDTVSEDSFDETLEDDDDFLEDEDDEYEDDEDDED